jgi:macrolide phosphotransferase
MEPATALEVTAGACAAAGLRLDPATAWRNDEGWAYHTVEVDDVDGRPWIFRFPSRPQVTAALSRELALLPWIAGRLPVAVPRPRIVGHEPPFMAYPRLAGHALSCEEMRCPAVADAVARLLVTLHELPLDQVRDRGLPEYDRESWRRYHVTLMARAHAAVDIPAQVRHRWDRALADDGLWPERMCLVHGDIGPPHLLAEDGRLTGVIDWESARIADPALDLAGILAGWNAPALAAVLDRYLSQAADRGRPDDPRLPDRVAFLAAAGPLHTIGYGLDTGRTEYVELGAAALRAQVTPD